MKAATALAPVLKNQSTDPLLTPPEAAAYIGVTENTLSVWRCVGRYSIPFIKVGRLVKYRKSALDAFLNRRTHGGEE
ncbi:helix-turn-helix domain-containing protein [Nitrosomonas ureae]|uniref:DNA binding domain-containing protein, excisionase family n=1 Tax=Nitrosomonas ureae TaxID=44577 RepID=A0A1H9EAB0_9PROT|nr:helix-turn-helix domain-containing protein [Nitrosomonas ureae]SEQ22631.1 DNA binding domain-containing protein, excisionase family [Nitrosomonas ureae]